MAPDGLSSSGVRKETFLHRSEGLAGMCAVFANLFTRWYLLEWKESQYDKNGIAPKLFFFFSDNHSFCFMCILQQYSQLMLCHKVAVMNFYLKHGFPCLLQPSKCWKRECLFFHGPERGVRTRLDRIWKVATRSMNICSVDVHCC